MLNQLNAKYTFRHRQRHRSSADTTVRSSNNTIDDRNTSESTLQRRKNRFEVKTQTHDYGFVSRGETRLQDSETERRKYFELIALSFFKLCDEATKADMQTIAGVVDHKEGNMTMDGVLTSLRKLREALLGSQPSSFSKTVLLFSVRVAAPLGHYQTYVPSIVQLLGPGVNLSDQERQELIVLLLLHWAHFSNENSRAIQLLVRGCPDDTRTHLLLQSWITKDYYRWLNLYNAEEDNLRTTILKFGLPAVLRHMVKATNASYYNLPLSLLRDYLPLDVLVDDLKNYGAHWHVEGANAVIRSRKTKTPKTQDT